MFVFRYTYPLYLLRVAAAKRVGGMRTAKDDGKPRIQYPDRFWLLSSGTMTLGVELIVSVIL